MSLVFSEVHDWEDDPNVKQALVFTCNKAKEHFKEKLERRINNNSFGLSIDSDCGAIFKLRAIKVSNGKYISLLRCGITGHILVNDHTEFKDYEDAIDRAKSLLSEYVKI
jgi:hypothetical protein